MAQAEFSCEVCGKTPHVDNAALFRTGEKGAGKDPHWRCRDHLATQVDPEVKALCDLLCPPVKENKDV